MRVEWLYRATANFLSVLFYHSRQLFTQKTSWKLIEEIVGKPRELNYAKMRGLFLT